jgi:hypothetical protein
LEPVKACTVKSYFGLALMLEFSKLDMEEHRNLGQRVICDILGL